MNTQRDDVGIAIRSAFLVKGTKQKSYHRHEFGNCVDAHF